MLSLGNVTTGSFLDNSNLPRESFPAVPLYLISLAPAFNPWRPLISPHHCSFLFFSQSVIQMEPDWITYSLFWFADQGPGNMNPKGERVYFGLQFEGKVHRGGAAFVAGILHPLSKSRMRNVRVQFTHSAGSQPRKGTINIRVSLLTAVNLDYLPQTQQAQVRKDLFPSSH
jgi:hypothetical protein